MKTSELTGKALNAAVALAQGWTLDLTSIFPIWKHDKGMHFVVYYQPSTDWKQGGPIIERYWLEIGPEGRLWRSFKSIKDVIHEEYGKTPLEAAMKCFVSSTLGDTVELPEGLKL